MDSHEIHALVLGLGVGLVAQMAGSKQWPILGIGFGGVSYAYMRKFGHGMPRYGFPNIVGST